MVSSIPNKYENYLNRSIWSTPGQSGSKNNTNEGIIPYSLEL